MNLMQNILKRFLLAASMLSISIILLKAETSAEDTSQVIERLTPPRPMAPPSQSWQKKDDPLGEQLKIKKKARKARELERLSQESEETMVSDEIPKKRIFCLELSLVGGFARTSLPRSGYTYEPNTHINLFFRLAKEPQSDEASLWLGFRTAPFVGTGFHHKTPGRYALTYIGPSIGWGRIEKMPLDSGSVVAAQSRAKNADTIPVLNGYVFNGGASAVIQQGSNEAWESHEGDDFSKKGLFFDPPGIWAEMRYLRIYEEAASFHLIFGLQTGKTKQFIYTGIGFGGWN